MPPARVQGHTEQEGNEFMRNIRSLAFASVSLLSLASPAFAQDADAADDADKDIVVTGTLIRGTQATGSQTITVDASRIEQIAATSTNELLTSIPQMAGFGQRPEGNPRGLTAVSAINRPNLRNFPSTNSTSGALTLIMIDGLRLTPVGTNAASVDPDIIPAAVLEGFDIVTDGGSSLYGADAVAGVMNFRTKRKFEGVKIDGNYGFSTLIKGFKNFDVALTVGKSWSTGNAYISVGHNERDAVLNRETPWANGTVYNAAGVASVNQTTCNTPQATVTRWGRFGAGAGNFTNNPLFAGAGPAALGTGCDQQLDSTYIPAIKRNNVFAAVTNEFSDKVSLRTTAYWVKREIEIPQYPLGFTSAGSGIASAAALTAAFPAALNTPVGGFFSVTEGVGFALGPNSNYVNNPSFIGNKTWGITPELTYKIDDNWQLRTSMHFGRSDNTTHFPAINTVATNGYIASGALNPQNVSAASASVIADITNWEVGQDTKHQLFMIKSVADGTVFHMPAGEAKMAVGFEFQNNKAETRVVTGKLSLLPSTPYASNSRSVKSLFAEVKVPFASFLDLVGSLRYDHYSDFGGSTNPNLGFNFKPASWLKVFGHWGTSYNAPTAYDNLGVGSGRDGTAYSATSRPQIATGKTDNGQGTRFIVLTGTSPDNPPKPQTSDAWAVGFEIQSLENKLSFGGEFYAINLKNALGSINPANSSTYITNPDQFFYNNELTANGNALYNRIIGQLVNGASLLTSSPAASVGLIVDTRTTNVNDAKVRGVDFHVNFQTETSFGRISWANNASLSTRALINRAGAVTDELGHGGPQFRMTSVLGLKTGGLSSAVTVNYSGKYRDDAVNNLGVEEPVKPTAFVNLNLGYDFASSEGSLSGLSLRLTVNNLFDKGLQTVRRLNTNNPTFLGYTLGREIKLGASFKF
jgi:iron complex outermembrane recepter protein